MPEASLLAVLLLGLLGAGHCAGMCGGIVSALSAQSGGTRVRLHLAYSTGRIASYATAGAIAGSLGGLGLLLSEVLPVQLGLYIFANVMMLMLGLYLAGMSSFVVRFENLGRGLWRRIAPLTRGLVPADTMPKALTIGVLWGWLPCGLVYSVLAIALFSGSAVQGAVLMAAFGLGTLPSLLGAGLLVSRASRLFRSKAFRAACGALVFGFGLTGLARAFDLGDQIRNGILCFG